MASGKYIYLGPARPLRIGKQEVFPGDTVELTAEQMRALAVHPYGRGIHNFAPANKNANLEPVTPAPIVPPEVQAALKAQGTTVEDAVVAQASASTPSATTTLPGEGAKAKPSS